MKIQFTSPEARAMYGLDFSPETEESAGVDLRFAGVTDNGFIQTGVKVAIPPGHVGLVFVRSSIGLKHDLQLKNSVGVIDSDYRGEIMARLTNCKLFRNTIVRTDGQSIVNKGERFAQLVVLPIVSANSWDVVPSLDDTDRGEGGIGHTGAG